ncbi:MAG: hypothetical protein DRO11_06525 [Methanobacteriota archaeon]|nr:MAG: hypothetical protein DRO11_06525 [Euryarchaeota archaeon]
MKKYLAMLEAIFRSRRENKTHDSLIVFNGYRSVILGGSSSYSEGVNHEVCKRTGTEIVRAESVSRKIIYEDEGSLNIAFIAHASALKSKAERYIPVLSEYEAINEAILEGLKNYNMTFKSSPECLCIGNSKLVETLPYWFYDYLMYHAVIHLDTNLENYKRILSHEALKEKGEITSLALELGRKLRSEVVLKEIVRGVRKQLNINFENSTLTSEEKALADKLYRVKYSRMEWVKNRKAPFLSGMGKTTVEIFVAYPPTSKGRELIKTVKEAISGFDDKVEVKVWMRGRGLSQHGENAEMSPALRMAEKANIIPAVIINGELKFKEDIPDVNMLRKAIIKAVYL